MPFEEICSYLVREPWNCSMDQIANMSIRQMQNIYFRPREDTEGSFEMKPLKPGMPFQQIFKKRARIFGKTDDEIREKWNEMHAAEHGAWEDD